jgi:hypothetical protein
LDVPARNRFTRIVKELFVFLTSMLLLGCAQTAVKQRSGYHETRQSVSVLLMPVDIELSALTAGGVSEVRADWTETAKRLVSEALARQLAQHGDKLLGYEEPADPAQFQLDNQLIKLHGVVGKTIFIYDLVPAATPPTRQGSFDWSLGSEVSRLRETSGADYGLFVYIRDSYATAGRKALIVTSALFGFGVAGGSQIGFCTLVDLRDGNIVWFNRVAKQTGDLRTPDAADVAVRELLAGIPL